jgi:serine/threonine protein kinase
LNLAKQLPNIHLKKMSLNEVRLLSRLDHPHIIAFYDSFEEDGILMIEVIKFRIVNFAIYSIFHFILQMEYADGG